MAVAFERRDAGKRAWTTRAAALLLTLSTGLATQAADMSAGEYVYRAAGCAACHTDEDRPADGPAGGRALATPFGTYYSSNITPDPEHGIGRWSEQDLARALRKGVAPGGRRYAPVFPYTAYTGMHDGDVRALYQYLMSLAPVARPNREHEVAWYLPGDLAYRGWQLLFLREGRFAGNPSRSQSWNRGAYLATALGHCGECHTPRGVFGALNRSRPYAGSRDGAEGEPVPNISGHREHGIGRWRQGDLVTYFEMGMTPDADFAGGLMAGIIDDGLSRLIDEDRTALAEYLKSMPAFAND